MDEAGILVMDEEEQKEKPKSTRTSSKTPGTRSQRTEIAAYTKEKLDTMLQQALDAEDYELAAAVRDEINRRK
jgi:protein-arginine kinase activator protein McsA